MWLHRAERGLRGKFSGKEFKADLTVVSLLYQEDTSKGQVAMTIDRKNRAERDLWAPSHPS